MAFSNMRGFHLSASGRIFSSGLLAANDIIALGWLHRRVHRQRAIFDC
ncbi:hypothetical protein ACGEN5_22530 [Pseudomonas aeruginosa]